MLQKKYFAWVYNVILLLFASFFWNMGVVSLMHDEAAVAMWPILQDHKFTRTAAKRTNAFKKILVPGFTMLCFC